MRILRLGNSDDVIAGVPEESRAYVIAGNMLAEASGEAVETVVKPIWPGPELPGLVERWLAEYEPDVVFLKVTWYWYGYESVPRRIERRLGWLGRPIARASLKAAETRSIAHNRVFRRGRRLAHQIIGGDSDFSPEEVIERMQACIRKVLANESTILVVKGTGGGRAREGTLEDYYDRFTRKRELVEGTIEAFCKARGVMFVVGGPKVAQDAAGLNQGDAVHKNVSGHARVARNEGASLIRAWEQSRIPAGSPPPRGSSARAAQPE